MLCGQSCINDIDMISIEWGKSQDRNCHNCNLCLIRVDFETSASVRIISCFQVRDFLKMALEILIYGHPTLKGISAPLTSMTPDLRKLVDDMAETMYNYKGGIGLAAPQVGELRRVVVLDVEQVLTRNEPKPSRRLQVFINPEILWQSEEDNPFIEGCLSIPGVEGEIYRPLCIGLRFRNEDFKECEIEAEGYLARVLQHEVDHLNGVLFVDRLKFTQRALIAGKLNRLRRQTKAGLASNDTG